MADNSNCSSCGSPGAIVSTWWTPVEDPGTAPGEAAAEAAKLKACYQVTPVKCTGCGTYLGVVDHLENDRFYSIEDTLKDKDQDGNRQSWIPVETHQDRRILFVLNQLVYNFLEPPDESLKEYQYALTPPEDLAKVIWVDGEVAGFYTVQLKGTLDTQTMQALKTTTFDTVFIRKKFRRRGLATKAVEDMIASFPQEEFLGFSHPVSASMIAVIRKLLLNHPQHRQRLWETKFYGGEGNIKNFWLLFQSGQV